MVKIEEFEVDDTIYTISVGETAEENWAIIDAASQNDLWFHVENNPSCHVIVSTNGETKVDRKIIKFAAALCKQHTPKLRSVRKLKIIYTTIKNVKKVDPVGSVHTKNTKTVVI